MWKIIAAFVAFAAVAMFVIVQGGDGLDMSGEKHGTEATESGSPSHAAASTPAPAPTAAR